MREIQMVLFILSVQCALYRILYAHAVRLGVRMSMSTTKRSAPGGDGETGKTSRSGLLGGKGEWAGRGEELLREQLRNVQEECR